ncbi:MAG: hypothetical protein H7A51_16940 [Akkermansiaceae bacterium]|nr:hypothetical protein [Akkermansiaceae bacterium]
MSLIVQKSSLAALAGCTMGVSLALGLPLLAQTTPDYDLAPVLYSSSKDHNTITRLQEAIDSEKFNLPDSEPKEILKALLDELQIPVSSQMLVFSKTSLQRDLITPAHPRAVYFNSDFYVGWVPGGIIEVVACDDPKGMMFYSFDINKPVGKRTFVRNQECMTCHASKNTMDVPGLLVRSVFTEKDGQALLSWGSSLTTPASPMADRWGGWYVTGTHGQSGHMGNKWVTMSESGDHHYNKNHGLNVTDLSAYFDTGKYLTGTSDILALMIMEHQIDVHNKLAAAKMGYLRRVYLGKAINEGQYDSDSPAARKMLQGYVDSILKALLFADEVRLPEDGISGSKAYQKDFVAQGVHYDGHSLRDLRLEKRIFKYRCSFMIHSKAFDLLPEEIKTPVLKKLHRIVTGRETPVGYPRLSSREQGRIHAILSHTHKGYQAVLRDQ